ncbi:MAG: N-6 DNA methylase [Zoogloeaceae bacterium]|jgi:hypothetical protein|nr:N-6 DNA methylase [Zoogloeaceae bacterium]
METLVSTATRRNWSRLNVKWNGHKLTRRANKTNSVRNIVPTEYYSNIENIPIIENIISTIDKLDVDLFSAMYSIALNIFNSEKLAEGVSSDKANVRKFIAEYSSLSINKELMSYKLPNDEEDLLGLIYQSLCKEGDKNKRGLYYTPLHITRKLTAHLIFSESQTFFDPCCGSGSFLRSIKTVRPTQLYGVDCDRIAVMLCKANLILQYQYFEFYPNIYCFDFLSEQEAFDTDEKRMILGRKYDYIYTNPPWGAIIRNNSISHNYGDAFSCFLHRASKMLSNNGSLMFLLPEAVLNVKTHARLRAYLLDNYSVDKLHYLNNLFTGVTTRVVALTISRSINCTTQIVSDKDTVEYIPTSTFRNSFNFMFLPTTSKDKFIVDLLKNKGKSTLADSVWALGIVTGNNAEKLLDVPVDRSEAIYTGKEILPYRLLPNKKYIVYDRAQFQQAAKEEIYRAKEKLVYKFISNKLVFAYDNKGSLFLNSANIVIPNIPAMSILSALLFLNSELFQFAYNRLFGGVKILKGNLSKLPFPYLTTAEDMRFSSIARQLVAGNTDLIYDANMEVYNYYNVADKQIKYIKEVIGYGTTA